MMELDLILKLAAIWGPIALGAAGFTVAVYVAIRYKMPSLLKRVTKIENIAHVQEVTKLDLADTVKKHEIYGKNGAPLYQHAADCKTISMNLQQSVCKKVDEMKKGVADLAGSVSSMDKTIAVLSTRVESMMDKDRTKELESFANILIKKLK